MQTSASKRFVTSAFLSSVFTSVVALASWTGLPLQCIAQSELLNKALSQKPLQDDVPYDEVAADKVAKCEIEEVTRDDGKGFLVTGEGGQTLRWFVDTNADNKLDRWCYFRQGVETYREVDTDFDRTADQFRWLGTGGTRWGIDDNADGKIDSWRMISAEEVTAEIVRAAATRDANRFAALLLSEKEITTLQLGTEKSSTLRQKSKEAKSQFEKWAAGQNVVVRNSRWTHFGAEKPGTVPAGTDGAQKDVVVYENVVALLETNDKPQQLLIGTLIQVGNLWRAVDLPRAVTEGAELADSSVFFNASFSNRGQQSASAGASSGMSKSMERLVNDLQEVDDKLQKSEARDRAKWHSQRADVLEKLIAASETDEDRTTWIKQFADTVNAAAQTGEYPDGVTRLSDLRTKLVSVTKSEGDVAYVAYRTITAEYTQEIQKPNVDFPKAQKAFLGRLEEFVNKYSNSEDAAEAMVQIGMGAELVGDNVEAIRWYGNASKKFGNTLPGRKAAGAMKRLDLPGKKFTIAGKTLAGKDFNSKDLAGGPVVFHYWASWCEPCKAEMRALSVLQSKYSKEKLRIVGINVDSQAQTAKDFLKANSFPWDHIYEADGLDGNLAVGLGVFNLPVNVVVDGQSQVVKSSIHWSELEAVLERILKK